LSRIGLAVAIPTLMIGALFTPQLAHGSRIEAPESIGAQPAATAPNDDGLPNDIRDQDTPESREMNGPVDLYGNDITDAVAKYKFDATGSLYETHSPQTELPRLGSPKS